MSVRFIFLILILFSTSSYATNDFYTNTWSAQADIAYPDQLSACEGGWVIAEQQPCCQGSALLNVRYEPNPNAPQICGITPAFPDRECGFCFYTFERPDGFIVEDLFLLQVFGRQCNPNINYTSTAAGRCAKSDGPPACAATASTNPIDIFRGAKYQQEVDYNSTKSPALTVSRSYYFRSSNNVLAGAWRFNQRPFLEFINIASLNSTHVVARRGDYSGIGFTGTLATGFTPESDVTETLSAVDDGNGNITSWQLNLNDDRIEEYDAQGRIISISRRDGFVEATYTYDDVADTITVTDQYGESVVLTISSNTDLIDQFTDPDGNVYKYTYFGNRLRSVIYPDDTPANDNDNPTKIYHYENTFFTAALTGITDENGNRTATWEYDSFGRAISSEHGNSNSGIDLVTIDYTNLNDLDDPRVTVTNPLGKPTTYRYETIMGVRKSSLVEGHATPTCAAMNQSRGYDDNGFLNQEIDWEGNITNIINDSRGLQTSRTEAAGTPEERTITTEWHPTFRLPTKITEPGKETTFTYDTQGRLLSRTESEL